MLLLAPILGAGYTSSTPTAPTPPHETTLLDGLTFPEDDWEDTWAYPLLDGPDLADTSDADINATMEVCCEVEDPVGPDCAEMGASCGAGLTQHRVRGWEDGGSVSYDGAGMCYGYSQHDITRLVVCYQPCLGSCLGGGGSQSKCAVQCNAYCGPELVGPAFDNESQEFDLYEASIDSTEERIVGLGEPSLTKDGRFLYFLYMKKTSVGTPIPECGDPEYTGTPPGDPCRCENDAIQNQTADCTPRPCQLETPDPPGCVPGCTEPEIENETECLPWATLMCESPDTATGVDGYEFGIAVARRPSWNVNLGVVRTN